MFSVVANTNAKKELVIQKYFAKYYGYIDYNYLTLEVPNNWKEKVRITKDDFNSNPNFKLAYTLKLIISELNDFKTNWNNFEFWLSKHLQDKIETENIKMNKSWSL